MMVLWAVLFAWMGARAAEPPPLDQAIALIASQLPDPVDDSQLMFAALQGITDHLNRQAGAPVHAVLTTAEHRALAAHYQGHRDGLGALYRIVAGQGLTLEHVYPDGPAAQSGLQRGDMVIAINNHPFTGLGLDDIFQVANAEAMLPTVVLDVRRAGRLQRVSLSRGPYVVPMVSPHPTDADCVEVLFFGVGAADRLRARLSELDPSAGVVLDLRDNQGGMLDEAVAAADLFLEAGAAVVTRRAADGTEEVLVASGAAVWSGAVAVVTNERTAGAAEAFVAALQGHQVARTAGTATAGLAREPSYYPLGGGLVLQLADTVLRPPAGASWDGGGLTPDVWVEPVSNSPSGILPDVQLSAARGLLGEP